MASELLNGVAMLEMLAPGTTEARSLTIDGPPQSKARARFTKRGGAYHPAENRAAEQRTAWHLKRSCPEPMTGNIAIVCTFYRPNRQRVDADNLLKHVCDAANGVLWLDDSQVTAIAGVVELDRDNPRTVVTYGRHESTMIRDRGSERPCARCGKPFTLKSKAQKLCSRACHETALVARNRAAATRTRTPCEGCGARTSKPGVRRCRACWKARAIAAPMLPIAK